MARLLPSASAATTTPTEENKEHQHGHFFLNYPERGRGGGFCRLGTRSLFYCYLDPTPYYELLRADTVGGGVMPLFFSVLSLFFFSFLLPLAFHQKRQGALLVGFELNIP